MMRQFLIMYTVGSSPVQFRIYASTKTAQEVAEKFMRGRKFARIVGVYEMTLKEVKL